MRIAKKNTCIRCHVEIENDESMCEKCHAKYDRILNNVIKKRTTVKSLPLIFLLAFMLIGTGCNRKLRLAKKCAEMFPAQDSITVVERKVIDTLILPDTYIEYIDTTVCLPSKDTVGVIKPVVRTIEGQTIYLDRIQHDTIRIRMDRAKLEVLNGEINKLKAQKLKLEKSLAKSKGQLNTWWKIFAGLLGVAGVAALILFVRRKKK